MTGEPQIVSVIPRLAPRNSTGHKGSYGHVLVVAGSNGMSGAAVLCGSAALRSGAGLVTIACPSEIQPIVAMGNPCYMTVGISHSPEGASKVRQLADAADVIAIGPGLGRGSAIAGLVRALVMQLPEKPIVLDADGLNNMAPIPGAVKVRPAPLILTPHLGEFSRLTGRTIDDLQANRESAAVKYARGLGVTLLLKGHRTVVTDGRRLYVNETGNPGMATGGSGDVLTGVLAALLGQGFSPLEATILAAWVHGRAGDLGAATLSQVSLTASDVLQFLPQAFREVEVHEQQG
jgi:ADP-dependent NAD(P)H-hydrate dehydratase